MLYIYVDQLTERCLYTFDFFFKEQGIPFRFTNDVKFFLQHDGPRFNYSSRILDGIECFQPATVLMDEGIVNYSIEKRSFNNQICFAFDGLVDPFATVFYILSRMEEYTDNGLRDEHNRFSAKRSYQYQFGCLQQLVCDRLVKAVIDDFYQKQLVNKAYYISDLEIIPTFDIDHTYAYKYRDFIRSILAKGKDLITRNKARIQERKLVLNGQIKDPYDTFEYILGISQTHKVHLFWLLGNYTTFDRNISHHHPMHQRLIRSMMQRCIVGIHPSYLTNSSPGQLVEEICRLKDITGNTIIHSRQHFLKLQLPLTYRELLKAGIRHDYTMGYATQVGFRAGTLKAFHWFDLDRNQVTDLLIHPFAYMDGTLLEYKHWNPETAISEIQKLYDEASLFGGDFYFLWHNETIGDYGKWKGWKKVLDFTLNLKNDE